MITEMKAVCSIALLGLVLLQQPLRAEDTASSKSMRPSALQFRGANATLPVAPSSDTAATVDFTPVPKETKLEGATIHLVQFRPTSAAPGTRSLEYQPPWPIAGTPDKATMRIPLRDAVASMQRVTLPVALDAIDEGVFKQWMGKRLGDGVDAFKIENIAKNPVKLNGKPTVEVTMTYGYFGRNVRHSILLCERHEGDKRDLISFEIQSAPADFQQLHRTFQSSLYSLSGF